MDYYEHIAGNFQETIELIAQSVDNLAQPIELASQLMSEALLKDRKIIACGNGPDSALAQLFTGNLLNRFEHERPALPALSLGVDASSLTGIASSDHADEIFSRQVNALGQSGDVLLCISSDRCHANLRSAIQVAQSRNMAVVTMSNSAEQEVLRALLLAGDVDLPVAARRVPRVVELHTMTIQCLCELIDLSLFGNYVQD